MDNNLNTEGRPQQVPASGWVKLLRFVAYAGIVLGCLLSLIVGAGVVLASRDARTILVGLVIVACGVLLSFVNAATIMIFLDLATDVKAIRAAEERRR